MHISEPAECDIAAQKTTKKAEKYSDEIEQAPTSFENVATSDIEIPFQNLEILLDKRCLVRCHKQYAYSVFHPMTFDRIVVVILLFAYNLHTYHFFYPLPMGKTEITIDVSR